MGIWVGELWHWDLRPFYFEASSNLGAKLSEIMHLLDKVRPFVESLDTFV